LYKILTNKTKNFKRLDQLSFKEDSKKVKKKKSKKLFERENSWSKQVLSVFLICSKILNIPNHKFLSVLS